MKFAVAFVFVAMLVVMASANNIGREIQKRVATPATGAGGGGMAGMGGISDMISSIIPFVTNLLPQIISMFFGSNKQPTSTAGGNASPPGK